MVSNVPHTLKNYRCTLALLKFSNLELTYIRKFDIYIIISLINRMYFLTYAGYMVYVMRIHWPHWYAPSGLHCTVPVEITLCCMTMIWRGNHLLCLEIILFYRLIKFYDILVLATEAFLFRNNVSFCSIIFFFHNFAL